MDEVTIAVNGELMRGLASHAIMRDAGARFVAEGETAPVYRLWSIDDRYPAMVRMHDGGASIALELYELTALGVVYVLEREPPGLSIGRVLLAGGDTVLGVVGEPFVCEGRREITGFGGWRAYLESLA